MPYKDSPSDADDRGNDQLVIQLLNHGFRQPTRIEPVVKMSRVTERRFKQEYSFTGVTKGPSAYADEVIASLQRSYVNAAISAPWVRIAQFGSIVERGKGTEWRIDYTQRDYSLNVLQDVQTRGGPKWAHTPLHHAANKNHLDIVELLIQHGATVDARDNHLTTPLMLAAMQGSL
jgi:ankyrin repeat protein